MYCVYNYKAGSTASQVLNDLILILTGTTSTGSLSASCVAANTSFSTTYAVAGWSLYDAAATATSQVIRSLNQDGSTYKYVQIGLTSSIASFTNTYEGWNAGTHVGTPAAGSGAINSVWDAAGGGYFYIYATGKNIIIQPWTIAGYQTMNGWVINELVRENIPAGYPCHVQLGNMSVAASSTACAAICRIKIANAAGDANSGTSLITGAMGLNSNGMANTQLFRNSADVVYLAAYRLAYNAGNNTIGWMMLGYCYDFYITGVGGISNLDEISYSGTTYVFMRGTTSNINFMVPKG